MIEKFLAQLRADGVAADAPLVIFDVGSRDCGQSIEFYEAFPNARIVAFECNPQTLPLCAAAAAARADRLTLVPKAVHVCRSPRRGANLTGKFRARCGKRQPWSARRWRARRPPSASRAST